MFEKALHSGNIAAAFAVAATTTDLTLASGAAGAITAALSGTAIYKRSNSETRRLAMLMAGCVDHAMNNAHMTDQRRLIVAQMLGAYQPTDEDIVNAALDVEVLAQDLCSQIKSVANDPAHRSKTALEDFRQIVIAVFSPVLTDATAVQEMEPAIFRKLLASAQSSPMAERMREEGITEKAIIRLAQRYSEGADDLGQAWLELQNAMDVAVRVQQEGRMSSNHGDFVDTAIKRVAEFAAEGAYPDARASIDEALAKEEAAHKARKGRLLESGIEIARLENDPARFARLIIERVAVDGVGAANFEQLRTVHQFWFLRGCNNGLSFELTAAVYLAEACCSSAQGPEQRGRALTNLADSLFVLGERESGVARLEQAISTYQLALTEWTRKGFALLWAGIHINLGGAYQALGARESNTPMLAQAVNAYESALEEFTRAEKPIDWARIQNNLGNALSVIGFLQSNADRLEQAIAAFRAALGVWTKEIIPTEWAKAQTNLGKSLCILEGLGTRSVRRGEVFAAFDAALEVWDRDSFPLDWAKNQLSRSDAELMYFDKLGTLAFLDIAQAHVDAAKEVFVEMRAGHYIALADQLIADIRKRRDVSH